MQIDIGFGDAIYPEPELASFPVLLPMEAPVIRAYPREASIAEKFHAMVVLDIRNSRMKDFYDIWFMANTWTFDMASLSKALFASFERRGTVIPKEVPLALTEEFLNDSQKKQQWAAFVSRLNPGNKAPSLEEVGAILRTFLLPTLPRFADWSHVLDVDKNFIVGKLHVQLNCCWSPFTNGLHLFADIDPRGAGELGKSSERDSDSCVGRAPSGHDLLETL